HPNAHAAQSVCVPEDSRRMRRWVVALAVLVSLSAFSSGTSSLFAALSGVFTPFDLAQDVAGAREIAARRNPYARSFEVRHAAVLGAPVEKGLPYYPHPPLAAILIRPFASLPFATISVCWFAGTLGLLFLLALLVAEVACGRQVGQEGG